jgi:transglutaminase/protease-like cytokinesis protein 3
MLMKKLFSTLIFLFLFLPVFSQQENKYQQVDAFVKNYPEKIINQQSLDMFIDGINKNFTADTDKVRAAFYWITENITYNDNQTEIRGKRAKDITTMLQTGEAICSGYSSLMEYFCKKLAVECVSIDGTGRSLYTDIVLNPEKLSNDHAWNAVKLNGEWKLIDATWGSGYTDYSTGTYHKSRNEKYFLADPSVFIYKHLPVKPQWQLLDTAINAYEFCNWPFIDEGFFSNNIAAVYPFQLNIDKKAGDTVQFKFYTTKEVSHVALESLDNQLVEKGKLFKGKNYYSYTFRPKKTGEFDLRVSLFNLDEKARYSYVTYTPALIYRLRVKSK